MQCFAPQCNGRSSSMGTWVCKQLTVQSWLSLTSLTHIHLNLWSGHNTHCVEFVPYFSKLILENWSKYKLCRNKCMSQCRPYTDVHNTFSDRSTKMKDVKILKYLWWMSMEGHENHEQINVHKSWWGAQSEDEAQKSILQLIFLHLNNSSPEHFF